MDRKYSHRTTVLKVGDILTTQGYVKLYRGLGESDIFHNEKLLKVFIWCLFKATHKKREQRIGRQKVELQEGQFVFGRNKASIELNMAPSTLWDYMKLLEERHTINIKSNNKFSIVTVEKWAMYQCTEEKTDIKVDKKQTSNKQQMDTNKNVKNVKNKYIYVETSNEYRLAKYLFELIRKNNPTHKEPNLQTWAKHIDYMIRIDKRKVEDIEAMIYWCQHHKFWHTCVLSTGKLREKYDQLSIQMKQRSHDQVEEPKGRILDFKIGGE